jgi:ligand-binding sensor domain-containing protein/signal transduction histidine kinase
MSAIGLLSPRAAFGLDPEKSLSQCTADVFGIRDGLAGSSIRAITQTADGYLWIGADGAVRRYDGARVDRLQMSRLEELIGVAALGNQLVAVRPSADPVCVMGGGGLGPCAAGSAGLPAGTRLSAVDRQPRGGALWLAGPTTLHQLAEGRPARIVGLAGHSFGAIRAIHEDRRGRLWIGASHGLFVGAAGGPPETFALHPGSREPDGASVRSIFESPSGRLWVLSDDHLQRIDGDVTETFRPPDELADSPRTQVIEDSDGNVWMGTQSGLLRFRDGRFWRFTKRDGLPDDDVTALYEDRERSLWVGTRSGALAQFTDRTAAQGGGPPGLHDAAIESVTDDAEGALWFASWLGLTRWKDGHAQNFKVIDGPTQQHLYAVVAGIPGTLWVGTQVGLVSFRWREGNARLWPGPRVVTVALDAAGTVWLGTDQGLARLHDHEIQPVPPEPGFTPGQVRAIAPDDHGLLWVTTEAGLARVSGGRLRRAQSELGGTPAADRGIHREPDGTLWFGAGTSLVRRRQEQWRIFTAADGLPADPIFQVLPDDAGSLWLATSRALVRISRGALEDRDRRGPVATLSLESSDERREIAVRRSRSPGAVRTRDGRLWFASLRGVVSIDPRRVRTNRLPPPVRIEKAIVDGRPAAGDGRGFPPGPGTLEFHFAGLTLVEPQKAQHRYRLEGFDRHWIEAGPRRVAYYTNIPPGHYVFRVQAANADGVWNEAGASLELRLLPHFYRTTWFYVVCGLALLVMGLSIYRMRLHRLRGQFLAVFGERTRVARELHDSLLQGMAAAALELENVREALPPAATVAAARLAAVEDALSASLDETRRLVWDLRDHAAPSNDLGLALSRLGARLTEGKPVTCTVEVEGEAPLLPPDVQGGLFRIAQEALNNALRHAGARHLEVQLDYRDAGFITLAIGDDGQGFTPEEAAGVSSGHFGLTGMRERAHRMGGELEVRSAPGLGTRLVVRLPALQKRSER